jgi:hypothetical protein
MPEVVKFAMPKPGLVRFIPDCRDASRDFLIPAGDAWHAFKAGLIAYDETNAGFCPKAGVKCDMRPYRVA